LLSYLLILAVAATVWWLWIPLGWPDEIEHVRDQGRQVIIHQPLGTTVHLPASDGALVRDVLAR
jgi:hypothetical protein